MIGNVNDFTKALHGMNKNASYCAVFVKSSDPDSAYNFLEVMKKAGLSSQLAVVFSFENDQVLSVSDWRRRLYSDHPDIRVQAAEMLGSVTQSGSESLKAEDRGGIIRDLVDALTDSVAPVRQAAMRSLISLEGTVELLALLKDPEAELRRSAAWALGSLGMTARDAVPALIDALRDKDDGVRKASAWALERVFSQKATPAPNTVSSPRIKKRRRAIRPKGEGKPGARALPSPKLRWDVLGQNGEA